MQRSSPELYPSLIMVLLLDTYYLVRNNIYFSAYCAYAISIHGIRDISLCLEQRFRVVGIFVFLCVPITLVMRIWYYFGRITLSGSSTQNESGFM